MNKEDERVVAAIVHDVWPSNNWIWAIRAGIMLERERCAYIASTQSAKRKEVIQRIKEGYYPAEWTK